ncbi:acyl-CoA dehydrogenase family protein, partial [Chloroflexota bacterium]
LAAEELAWGDLAGAFAVLAPGLFALPILLAGSQEQKEKLLPKVIEAEWKPYSIQMSSPLLHPNPVIVTSSMAKRYSSRMPQR